MNAAEAFASQATAALGLNHQRVRLTHSGSVTDEAFIATLVSAVFACVAAPSALATNVRLLRGDQEVPRDRWVRSRTSHGQVVHTELVTPFVEDAIGDGALLVIDSADECDPTLMRVREALEHRLSARVWINVYVTATAASSFGPHADDMDTIIVQILGRKRWTIAPGPGDEAMPADAATLELTPGHVVAVPARTVHDVVGLGELSVHLTIGYDQEAGLVQRLRSVDSLLDRASAPPSDDELRTAKAMLPERRAGSSLPFRITGDPRHCQRVRWASQLPPLLQPADDDGVEVLTMGHRLTFDGRAARAVDALAAGHELDFEELLNRSSLDRDELVALLRTGVEAGWVIARPLLAPSSQVMKAPGAKVDPSPRH